MVRFLVAGDTHGDNAWMSRLVGYAEKREIGTIVQLGDFGFDHDREGRKFLDKTSSKLNHAGVDLYFVDGNHDNHPVLWSSYAPNPDGFCEVRERLYYLPRGTHFSWGGVRFLALGGAYSIDKKSRLEEEQWLNAPGTLWWPTETITAEQRELAIAGGPVDVMFTHDCPWGVSIAGINNEFWESNENRRQVAEVVRAVKPAMLFHGHYHERLTAVYGWDETLGSNRIHYETQVEGFSCNGFGTDAWGVVDLTPKSEVS